MEARPDAVSACERTVVEFTHAFDLGDLKVMARNFAPDGVWHRHDGDLIGLVALERFMRSRNPGLFVRHVLSNLRSNLISESRAVVESYVTVYRFDFDDTPSLPAPLLGPNVVGRYRDELTRNQHGWQLARREVFIDFKQRNPEP